MAGLLCKELYVIVKNSEKRNMNIWLKRHEQHKTGRTEICATERQPETPVVSMDSVGYCSLPHIEHSSNKFCLNLKPSSSN
jgi:hypothetical protein